MNRDIKFRGMSKNGYFIYGDLVHNGFDGTYEIPICIKEDGLIVEFVEPETIGEYTGLNDKNGKEIYEGDIIQDTQSKNIYEIKNIDGGFCICPFKDNDWRFYDSIHDMQTKGWILEYGKIIGNIHENPELLND